MMHMYNPVEKSFCAAYSGGGDMKTPLGVGEPKTTDRCLQQQMGEGSSRCPPIVRLLRTRVATATRDDEGAAVTQPQQLEEQLEEEEEEAVESLLYPDDIMPTPVFGRPRDWCFLGMALPKFSACKLTRKCRTGMSASSTTVKRQSSRHVERCYACGCVNLVRSASALSVPTRKKDNHVRRYTADVQRARDVHTHQEEPDYLCQECSTKCGYDSRKGEMYRGGHEEHSSCVRCRTASFRLGTKTGGNSDVLSQTPPNASGTGTYKDNCCLSLNMLNDATNRSKRFTSEIYRDASTFVVVPPSTTSPHGVGPFKEHPIACVCGLRGLEARSCRADNSARGNLDSAFSKSEVGDGGETSTDAHEATGLISVSELTLCSIRRSMTAMMLVGVDQSQQVECELTVPSPSTSLSPEHVNSPPGGRGIELIRRASRMTIESSRPHPLSEPRCADMELSSSCASAVVGINDNDSPSFSSVALYEWNVPEHCSEAAEPHGHSRSSPLRAPSELRGGVLPLSDCSRPDNQSLDSYMARWNGLQLPHASVKENRVASCRPHVVRSPMNFTIVSDAFDPFQHLQEPSVLDYARNAENISPVLDRPSASDAPGPLPPPRTPLSSIVGSNLPYVRSPSLFTPKRIATHRFHALRGLCSPVDAAASRERLESHSNSLNQRYNSQNSSNNPHYATGNPKEQPLEWTTRRDNSEGVLSLCPDTAPPLFSGLMLNFARLSSEASCASADTFQSTSSNNVSNLLLKVCQGVEWGKIQMPAFQLDQ